MKFLKHIDKYIFILFISFFLFSCKKDLKDKDQFAKHIVDLIKTAQTEKLMELFIMPKDSILMNDSSLIGYFKLYGSPEELEKLKKLHLSDIEDCIKDFEEKGLSKQSFKEIEAKYDTIHSFPIYDVKNAYWFNGRMEISFKAPVEYSISLGLVVLTKDGWKFTALSKPISKQEEKERIENMPYFDSRVKFIDGVYTMKSDNKTFDNLEIRISNKTPHDFNYIKYKIRLLALNQLTNEFDQEFFNKTIELKQKIFAGDYVRIEVNELKNYYTNLDLRNKRGFTIDVRILDIKPRPN